MQDSEIHIGDVLRIRSFESMKAEFGTDEHGDIHNDIWFPKCMSHLCEKTFTVLSSYDIYPNRKGYRSVEGVENNGEEYWRIRAWMLEPCNDVEDIYIATDDDIILLLS